MNQENHIFYGRLGRDPELAYTKNQEPVCKLSVAINKDKEEMPIWKKVVVWGKQAELCPLYLKKGKEVFVQGCISQKTFTNKKGEEIIYDEVFANVVGFTNT